jgi:hypothetical protein
MKLCISRFLASVVTIATTACGGSGDPASAALAPSSLFEASGRYFYGFEVNTFVPCGAARGWWVTSLDSVPAVREYQAAQAANATSARVWGDAAFVRWQGVRSDSGQYGHLGGAAYEFAPRAVFVVRDTSMADCR